mmetsp:Transcript_31777/g.74866  ORF Transcript_31777/g.74866 Transcript_31777/m.74866 type:complete len:163 (+) Transcript_31777:15-503(+)
MSRHLTSDQVDHFKEAFQLFDVDGGGSIDVDELGALMRFLGHNLSEKELGDMVERWDTSGTDTINVEGFLNMLASYSDVVDVEETMLAAFQEHDPAATGRIPLGEFLDTMTRGSDEKGGEYAIHWKQLQDFLKEKDLLDEPADPKEEMLVNYGLFVQEMLRI